MNPWESAPVAETAVAKPWETAEEAQKRFTYQPPFTAKSWWQRAREDFARDQPVRGKSFFEGWKEGIAAQTTPLREAREETERLQHEAEKENPYALVMGPKERSLSEGLALGLTGEAAGASLKAFVAGRGAKAAPATAAQIAHEAGYVLPPNMATDKLGTLGSTVQGLGGEIKTQQLASVKNQRVTNRLATKALELPEGTMLNESAFRAARAPALQIYKTMANSIPQLFEDAEFKASRANLGGRSKAAAARFTNTMKNEGVNELSADLEKLDGASPQEAIDLVRTLRAESKANLKAFDDPKRLALGQAQKQAANAVDELMERNLGFLGKPDLVKQYRAARQLIAKSYDVEAATNTATGNVSAYDLARMDKKGTPFTGELKIIADTARSFGKATQSPEAFGGYKRWSAVDAGVALGALFHNPALTAGIAARPLVRDLALSRIMQNRLAGPPRIAPPNSLMSIMRPVQPMVPTFNAPPP